MAVIKASYGKASAGGGKGAKQAVRYATHREDGTGERTTREIYDREGILSRQEAYARIDAAEQQGGKYHYRLILNQGEGHRAADMQAVTRDTMQALSDRHGGRLDWVAVNHDDHSKHQHAHVIAVTDKTLSRADLAAMRAEMDGSHERHSLRDTLRATPPQERTQAQTPERPTSPPLVDSERQKERGQLELDWVDKRPEQATAPQLGRGWATSGEATREFAQQVRAQIAARMQATAERLERAGRVEQARADGERERQRREGGYER